MAQALRWLIRLSYWQMEVMWWTPHSRNQVFWRVLGNHEWILWLLEYLQHMLQCAVLFVLYNFFCKQPAIFVQWLDTKKLIWSRRLQAFKALHSQGPILLNFQGVRFTFSKHVIAVVQLLGRIHLCWSRYPNGCCHSYPNCRHCRSLQSLQPLVGRMYRL